MFGREFGQVPEVNEHPVHALEGSVNTISTNPEQHSSQSPDGKIWSNADVTRVQLILGEEFDALCKKNCTKWFKYKQLSVTSLLFVTDF